MRSRVIVLTAVSGLLALPAATGATLVPQKSLAGVTIGMKMSDAKTLLGTPKSDKTQKDEIQGKVRHLDYGLTQVYGSIGADGEVQDITTSSKKQRTKDGIGVGSTKAAVKAKVKNVKCLTEYGYSHCIVGSQLPGHTITDFSLSKKGKVKSITLGIVID